MPMPVLEWGVPAVVVFAAAVAAVMLAGWLVRRARRSPRARRAADQARTRAGAALVHLDDAVAELDLQIGLSGALYGGDAPTSLARARLTAQHVRDEAFEQFRSITEDASLLPADVERRAGVIATHTGQAMDIITQARADNDRWVHDNASVRTEVDAARDRLAQVRAQTGDPDALVRELSAHFDASEWSDAAASATAAKSAAADAQQLLDRAAASAEDPSRNARDDLTLAERRIRTAQEQAQRLERGYASVREAADRLPAEVDAARDAIRQADETRAALDADAAARLGEALHAASDAVDAAEHDVARRPTAALAALARMRDRLDAAVGDARTSAQRLHGARTALPGTIAVAERAVAHADAAASGAGADARVRLAAAHDELAKTRQLADPVEALDAARRAIRHAEDAEALAAYDRR